MQESYLIFDVALYQDLAAEFTTWSILSQYKGFVKQFMHWFDGITELERKAHVRMLEEQQDINQRIRSAIQALRNVVCDVGAKVVFLSLFICFFFLSRRILFDQVELGAVPQSSWLDEFAAIEKDKNNIVLYIIFIRDILVMRKSCANPNSSSKKLDKKIAKKNRLCASFKKLRLLMTPTD